MPNQKRTMTVEQQRKTLHKNLNFTAAEAYKLLRTNLQFTLPGGEEDTCRVLGITSSIRGEGKSTTAVNLSYTLAETGKKVLLIDADMRLPSVGKKLEMPNAPGLSNVLVATGNDAKIAIRPSKIYDNWRIVTAGDIPPNPSELLGSRRMKIVLAALEKEFDYIIVDLPPVNVVSDTLIVSPVLDGLVVVVRENYTDRKELRSCVRQLNLSNAKVLGFVMTGAKESLKRYGKYKRYGKSYKYGYYRKSHSETEDGADGD
ncbi:MAG: CpsD/CapB family tyrosine-protein kinase [Oscillospiraceae bacterium]|nr:CpsD/CapB family tyrosine-protein kinase [Oscillospiraceae bacterium]